MSDSRALAEASPERIAAGRSELRGRDAAQPHARGPWRLALESLLRDRAAVVAGLTAVLLVVMAVFAPALSPYDPVQQDLQAALRPPSPGHLLGTDSFGRDILSRVLNGSRISLALGFVSVGIAVAIGLPLGLVAGYFGGRTETIIMRVMDVLLAFPGILLIIVVVAVLGLGLLNAMVAIGIASVPLYVRIVRASTISAKQEEYVTAARALGCTAARSMRVHLLPNVLSPLLVVSTLRLATAILTGSTLSYLGLGAQPPAPEWGAMLAEAMMHVREAWWLSTFPGLAILITVLAVNLFGDGLRDALDPKLRTR